MKNFYVEDAPKCENEKVVSFFVVAALQVRAKKTGEPFLQLTLADRTGQIEAKMWDNVESSLWQDGAKTKKKFDAGDCVKIGGQVNKFNDRFQLIVGQIRLATDAEKDPTDMLPVSRRDAGEMWAELQQRVATVQDPHLRELLQSFLNDPVLADKLRHAPAAKLLHHAWIGGLLEHILSLMALAESVLPHYPQVNRDLLLTGVILHDIGKLTELIYDNCFGYSLEGQMLGHITIGLGMARDRMAAIAGFPPKLRMLVEHLILSHHGSYEFGSPKLPMTAEAVMLSMLDDLDAKMQLMQSEFRRQQAAGHDGTQMTDWVRAMERPLLDTSRYLSEATRTASTQTPAKMLNQPQESGAQPGQSAAIEEVFSKPSIAQTPTSQKSYAANEAELRINRFPKPEPLENAGRRSLIKVFDALIHNKPSQMSAGSARKLLNEALSKKKIIRTNHFYDRAYDRGFDAEGVVSCLNNALIEEDGIDAKTGDQKFRAECILPDGKTICVGFLFNPEREAVLATIFDPSAREI